MQEESLETKFWLTWGLTWLLFVIKIVLSLQNNPKVKRLKYRILFRSIAPHNDNVITKYSGTHLVWSLKGHKIWPYERAFLRVSGPFLESPETFRARKAIFS